MDGWKDGRMVGWKDVAWREEGNQMEMVNPMT